MTSHIIFRNFICSVRTKCLFMPPLVTCYKSDIYQWAINIYSIQGHDGKWEQSCFRNEDETRTSSSAPGSVDTCVQVISPFFNFVSLMSFFVALGPHCSLWVSHWLLTAAASCVRAQTLGICASGVAAHSLSPQGMWALPGPGMEPVSPASAGRISYPLFHQGSPTSIFTYWKSSMWQKFLCQCFRGDIDTQKNKLWLFKPRSKQHHFKTIPEISWYVNSDNTTNIHPSPAYATHNVWVWHFFFF